MKKIIIGLAVILGLSSCGGVEEPNKPKFKGEIISSWFDEDATVGGVIHLIKFGDTLKMVTITKNYGNMTEIVKKTKQGDKIKYTYDNTHGEYYLIHTDGSLNMYERSGWFRGCNAL